MQVKQATAPLPIFQAALGHNVSDALAFRDLVQERQNDVRLAPPQLKAVRVFGRQNTFLKALYGPGDGRAAGYGISTPYLLAISFILIIEARS